jgi:hypothetical protein
MSKDQLTDAVEPAGAADGGAPPAGRVVVKRSIWQRLYHGETNVDFVGRRRRWFTLSLAAVAFATRDLNLGIDFEDGAV